MFSLGMSALSVWNASCTKRNPMLAAGTRGILDLGNIDVSVSIFKTFDLPTTREKGFTERPLKNVQFCSRPRKAKILTTPYDLLDLRGRHEYMEYFEDRAKAPLRAKC